MTTAASSSSAIVDSFIAAVCRKDLDGALALLADDVEYDNVPMRKVFGRSGVSDTLGPFVAGCSAIDWVVHHQVAEGDVVMNERLDRFEMGGRWVEVAVAGLFVLRDGLIVLWRDYFDLASFTASMGG